ncbi:MAG TPA: hypothetical protein VKU37_05810 [Verrucomicrobiae bacterium]|nr:hypothetical protein [Verrucomicrobiae bacterium]
MKIKNIAFFSAVIVPLLAGCASSPVAINPVGPGPTQPETFVPKGYLQVFSDTETHVIGDGPPYYPHTGYSIHDESGKLVQFVPNHIGDMDESPSIVTIPAGDYNVVAKSSAYGRVTVPVVIQGGQTTVVHLDRAWRPSASISTNGLVYLPNGEAVGWRSSAEN